MITFSVGLKISLSFLCYDMYSLTIKKGTHMQANRTYDFLFKILLIGDAGVGKTDILAHYTDDSFTSDLGLTTIGIDFKIKTTEMDGRRIKAQIWDTAGQERFRTITTAYWREAVGIMFVYDTSNEQSFQNIRTWMRERQRHGAANIRCVLVGHNIPRTEKVVEHARGEAMAKEYGMSFYEVSAVGKVNIVEAFQTLNREILSAMQVPPQSEAARRAAHVNRCKASLNGVETPRQAMEFITLLHPSALLDSKRTQDAVDKDENALIVALWPLQAKIVEALFLLPEEQKKTYMAIAVSDSNALLYKLCEPGIISSVSSFFFSSSETSTQRLRRALAEMQARGAYHALTESQRQSEAKLKSDKTRSDGFVDEVEGLLEFYNDQISPREGAETRAPLRAPGALLSNLIGAEEKLTNSITFFKETFFKGSASYNALEHNLVFISGGIDKLMYQFAVLKLLTIEELSGYYELREQYSNTCKPVYLHADVAQVGVGSEAKAAIPPAYNPKLAEPEEELEPGLEPDAPEPQLEGRRAPVDFDVAGEGGEEGEASIQNPAMLWMQQAALRAAAKAEGEVAPPKAESRKEARAVVFS